MLMANNTTRTWYGTPVQLLLMLAAISTPFLAFNSMDSELLGATKTIFITICASIKPWLCPPYVYLLLNFIIFFIAASSFFLSNNNITFNPNPNPIPNYSHEQSPADHFMDSSVLSQSVAEGFSSEGELNETCSSSSHGCTGEEALKEETQAACVVEKTKDLRKSDTFNEFGGRVRVRREKYVRILSQDELNRRVEAFLYKFNKDGKMGFKCID